MQVIRDEENTHGSKSRSYDAGIHSYVLELRTQEDSPKQFAKNHEIGGANFFEHKLKRGELITSACVEQRPGEDDDWITFEFGPPDVAVAAFESPASKIDKTKS